MDKKITILCVADHYSPGYKAGGVVRTLENTVNALSEECRFLIYTRDRDLGSESPYPDIQYDEWNAKGNALVFYARSREFGARGLQRILSNRNVDIIYLNSFFSFKGSIDIVLRHKWFQTCSLPILVAPRGEFSPGALKLKRFRKKAYILAAKVSKVYKHIFWHASTAVEAEDISHVFPVARNKMHIAMDPVERSSGERPSVCANAGSETVLRLAFVSRISPKKNLLGLLRMLVHVQCQVRLTIFGPIEDLRYWNECQEYAQNLPVNISLEYAGVLEPDEVSLTFAKYDLFAFPTFGENFGHVIFESLRGGTPVLVSDQTPWEADSAGAITVLPLDQKEAWAAAIERVASLEPRDRIGARRAALELAEAWIEDDTAREANLVMFKNVIETFSDHG